MLDQFPAKRAEAVRLLERGQYDAAASMLYQHLTSNPQDLFALANLGKACYFAGHIGEAARIFRVCQERRPEPAFLNGLGMALSAQNRMEEAGSCFRDAIRMDELFVDSWANLARIHRFTDCDPLVRRLKRLLRHKRPDAVERQRLFYAYAKAMNDLGRWDDAFDAARRGAEVAMPTFRPEDTVHATDRVVQSFTADVLAPRAGRGDPADAPVFVVGMPRSGTTLIEQILSRHGAVFAAGELTTVPRIVKDWLALPLAPGAPTVGPEWADGIPVEQIAAGARRYMAGIDRRTEGMPFARVVDKLPANIFHLGAISMMFPNARIVFAERDPRDVAVSCYFERFTRAHEYSYRLDWLGVMIRQSERLSEHFQKVLPNPWITVRYEELVAEPEPQIRRLLHFLGLDWDEACLTPERSRSAVRTASLGQVRRKINAGSVGRWRRYERHLGPLLAALESGGDCKALK